MKIRTFITCEDIDVKVDSNEIIIKKMLSGFFAKKFPATESMLIILTFDEVEEKEKNLEIIVMTEKNKVIYAGDRILEKRENAGAFLIKAEFPHEGLYYIKLSYDGEFLGKYPLHVGKDGDDDE